MGAIIRFVSKSELERIQLVREARAIYESVFPSTVAVNERRPPTDRAVGNANVDRSDGVQS
jgi:hypothetical protein